MLSVAQEVNRLRDLGQIQKCLVALSDNLSDPNYTLELLNSYGLPSYMNYTKKYLLLGCTLTTYIHLPLNLVILVFIPFHPEYQMLVS